ncbi:MAG: DUF2207 family protein [Methanobacteriaceae archaeon]
MVLESFNISIIMILLLIFPLIVYLIYEILPKIKHNKYNKEIYYNPPTNDPPALINSLFGGGINKERGEINIECFYSTLLDLINRKYVSVKIVSKKYKVPNKKNKENKLKKSQNNEIDLEYEKSLDKVILKINKLRVNKPLDKLYPFEKNVLKCISVLEHNGNIDILNTVDITTKRLKVNTFQKNYDNWIKNFYNEFFKNNKIKFFNNRFKQVLKAYKLFLLIIFVSTFVFSYLEGLYLNLVLILIIGILSVCLIIVPFKGLLGWTKEGKELKVKWDLFKNYYTKTLKNSPISQEFLDSGITHIPYLFALGIPRSFLISNFSQSNNITDTYLFLKYGTYSVIKEIVIDLLAADGTFEPKYHSTTGNFVPGYG